MKSLKVNQEINWKSAAGDLTGKVVDIILAENGLKQLVPWITIEFPDLDGYPTRTTLCGTEDNLRMMRVSPVL